MSAPDEHEPELSSLSGAELQPSAGETPPPPPPSHLRPLKLGGAVTRWALTGIGVGTLGLFLLTGLAGSPWLFLLYPALIGVVLVSAGALALHLLHRF